MGAVERQVASLLGQCESRDEKLTELAALLRTLQVRVDRLDEGGAGLASLVRSVVGQQLQDLGAGGLRGPEVRLARRGRTGVPAEGGAFPGAGAAVWDLPEWGTQGGWERLGC